MEPRRMPRGSTSWSAYRHPRGRLTSAGQTHRPTPDDVGMIVKLSLINRASSTIYGITGSSISIMADDRPVVVDNGTGVSRRWPTAAQL